MTRPSDAARWRRLLLPISSLLLLIPTACRTLDPSEDLTRASTLAESRLARPIEPADDAAPAWQGDGPLTLPVAVDLALRHSPEIAALRPRLAEARAQVVDAEQPPNPVFEWFVGAPIDASEAVPLFLSVAQHLGYLLQRDSLVRVAELDLEQEVLAAADAFVALVLEVEVAHREAVAAESREGVAVERQRLAEATLALARHRAEVGEATPGEVALALADLEQARAHAADVARDASHARLALLLAMGRPDLPRGWTLVDSPRADPASCPPDHAVSTSDEGGLESRLVAAARRMRLDLLAADLDVRARLESVSIAGRSAWDALSFGVGFDRDMEDLSSVAFVGTIPIPIFDDGSVARAKAEATWRSAMVERLALANQIEAEVRGACIDRLAALAMLVARSEAKREVDRARDAVLAAFEGGFAPLDEVLAVDARRLDAQTAWIDARLALDLAEVALRRAVGGSLAEPAAPLESARGDASPSPEDRS